ncbi:MAG: class I SAM-dependent methyltransferase [Lentisphaeria bacterium]
MQSIINKILAFANSHSQNFFRIFHGRGGCFPPFDDLTIDSIDSILLLCLYRETSYEQNLINQILTLLPSSPWHTLVLQRRYADNFPSEILYGSLPENVYAIENDLKFCLNLSSNRNSGFFPDMQNGRKFVQKHSLNKKVLNLFSYTCSFSVAAIAGGAAAVVNVDMAKAALSTGRKNHHINHFDCHNVQFMPYNILKSWGRILKEAPFDLIIIDPPSFQKGSFAATKDYQKIIRKISELAAPNATILAALNAPELNRQFLIDLFHENSPLCILIEELPNLHSFPSASSDKGLKTFIFRYSPQL